MADHTRADGLVVNVAARGCFVAITFPAAEQRIATVPPPPGVAPAINGSTFTVKWALGSTEYAESIDFASFADAMSFGLDFVRESAKAVRAMDPGGGAIP